MTQLFISDLHLDGSQPEIADQFVAFVRGEAGSAQSLYILGDLFEAWIGDDDPDPDKRRAVTALKELTERGTRCFLLHGNRDFLIGTGFCRQTGVELIQDGTIVDVYGTRVLLMHGDLLCTDDHSYQRLRRIVRNPVVQFLMRRLSLQQRQRLAERMRAGSKAHIQTMDRARPEIMDVNARAVIDTMRAYGVEHLVHGHTHRPAIHRVELDGRAGTRIVLGDWYDQGSVLRWDERGFELLQLARS